MYKNLICIFLISTFFACKDDPKSVKINSKKFKEILIEANKKSVEKEGQQINEYIKQHHLKTTETGTGLRYQIYKKGKGIKVSEGMLVGIKFKISLLNGKECYNSKNEVEKFIVGKDNVESGLHEAVLQLHFGDKAIIIIPSYLAHGLAGDFKKIPIKATIVYDLELVSLNN